MRDKIQQQAVDILEKNNYTGVVVLSMGTGKGKIAIDCIKRGGFKNILITSPRTNLKDMWKQELEKWGFQQMSTYQYVDKSNEEHCPFIITENIQTCYKWDSIKIRLFDLIIYDEIHTCGPEYFTLIKNAIENNIPVIGLTGTPNKNEEFKQSTLYTTLPILYEYHDSAKDGLINNRRYYIYKYKLSDDYKVIAGTKKKPFTVGEYTQYEYLSQQIKKGQILMAQTGSTDWFKDAADWGWGGKGTPSQKSSAMIYLNAIKYRKEFLWNLSSSADIAVKAKELILQNVTNKVLLFSELTTQANKLSAYAIHSKQDEDTNKKLIKSFDDDEIRELSSVRSLTLGLNLKGANWAILESYNSSPTDILQKLGRTSRLEVDNVANVLILVPEGTQAEQWFNEFSKSLDLENAIFINELKDLKI